MMNDSEADLATPDEAARYLRTTAGSLAQLRSKGGGPVFSKTPGGRVFYRFADLKRWATEARYSRTGSKVVIERP